MKAGERFIDRMSGNSGTIEGIFLAQDQRMYQEVDPEDEPDICCIVVRLDGGTGYWVEDVSDTALVPADTILN